MVKDDERVLGERAVVPFKRTAIWVPSSLDLGAATLCAKVAQRPFNISHLKFGFGIRLGWRVLIGVVDLADSRITNGER